MELPVYDVIMMDDDIGLTAVSFVDDPAIQTDFIYFKNSKNQTAFYLSNDEKQEVVSPILIPNQLIYRNQGGKQFYMRWTEETIERAAIMFLLNQHNNNVTIMHPTFYNKNLKYEDCLVEDVFMKKMWIVEDAKTDLINTKYGFNDLPKGTLCVHYKIHNKELWQRIKLGELKGLSIEAFMSIMPTTIAMNKNINKTKTNKIMNKKISVLNKLVMFLNEITDEAEDLATIAEDDVTDSGEVTLSYQLEDEKVVTVDAEGIVRDENLEPLAEGRYLLFDGNYLVVDADSKFVETQPADETEVSETPEEAPIAQEDEVTDETTFVVTIDGVDYEVPEAVFDYIKKLEAESTIEKESIEQFKTKIKKFKSEINQLKSRVPSTQPVSTVKSINQKHEDMSVEASIANALSKLRK